MSGPFGSSQWMYNAGGGFYDFPITNSVRFESGDSAYLNRTPGSASNRKTWTWSGWFKFGNLSTLQTLFFTGTAITDRVQLYTYLDQINLYMNTGGTIGEIIASPLLRDPSAWYHITVSFDTTQATDSNRVKLYLNGNLQSLDTATYPPQDFVSAANNTTANVVGRRNYVADRYLDGYLADVNFIDGTALTPASFGELKNDIWIPKDTSGLTFGTNGFRLQFKQTGTGTASSTTIGADTSGNDNHLTSNNLVASDVMTDSPTNNFATLNPLYYLTASTHLSEGNLQLTHEATAHRANAGTMFMQTGKWYFEVRNKTDTAGSTVALGVGLQDITKNLTYATSADNYIFYSNNNNARTSLNTTINTLSTDGTHSPDAGDIVQVAYDADSGKIFFGVSNTYYAADAGADGNPATGANPSATLGTTIDYIPFVGTYNNEATANFGQDSSFAGAETAQGNADENGIGDFYYAPPSGFLALCTANLPDPVAAIDPAQGGSPQDYFNTVLYTGNGTTQDITGVGFQPDWIWIKRRSAVEHHLLTDSVRGVTKSLNSNRTAAEATRTDQVTAFGADGFSLGDDGAGYSGVDGQTYASWNWKAGTAFSNDASATGVGSIDSSGSVNTDVGFSITTYTGTNSSMTWAHGLGVTPDLFIVKVLDRDDEWILYPLAATGNLTNYLKLDQNIAFSSDTALETANSTVLGFGSSGARNGSGDPYICYAFAEVDGFSKFGSYTGNGNADGPFVYTGFRPAFVMVKMTSGTQRWGMTDSARATSNPNFNTLYAEDTIAEYTGTAHDRDYLSNGFKLRNTDTIFNGNGSTYIYMAFAEQPFKYANAR